MENAKQHESQELTVEELADISGGVAVGEPYPGQYPTGDIYGEVSEAIAKQLENIKLPNWKYKHTETYTSETTTS